MGAEPGLAAVAMRGGGKAERGDCAGEVGEAESSEEEEEASESDSARSWWRRAAWMGMGLLLWGTPVSVLFEDIFATELVGRRERERARRGTGGGGERRGEEFF